MTIDLTEHEINLLAAAANVRETACAELATDDPEWDVVVVDYQAIIAKLVVAIGEYRGEVRR